jgi:hypothetical protein
MLLNRLVTGFTRRFKRRGLHTDRFLNAFGSDCLALLFVEKFLNSGPPIRLSF